MKLNSNDLYLSLMLETFEKTIAPELQSDTAKVAAGILQACFRELLRRERETPAIVAEANREGLAIIGGLQAMLSQVEDRPACEAIPALRDESQALAGLLDDNTALTDRMAQLSRRLSELRPGSARVPEVTELLHRAAQWEYQLHLSLLHAVTVPASKMQAVPLPQTSLEGFLQSVHPDGARVKVRDMVRAEGGSGKQTFLFKLEDAAGTVQDLVVRKSDHTPMVTHGAFVLEREFHLVRAVAETGFLAPKPLWLGQNVPGTDGDFYVMPRMAGRIPGTFLGGAEKVPESFLLHLAELLAQLHNLGIEPFEAYIRRYDSPAILTETIEAGYRRNIAEWRAYAGAAPQLPSPALEYLFDWLSRNVPSNRGRPILLHGDFNIHNILGQDGRVSAVLDWESAMFGAPEQDLAYIRPHISKHIEWDRFVGHYLECGGKPLDLATLDFYMAYSAMRVMHGLTAASQNLQQRDTDDMRLCMVQQGYVTEFMRLGLASPIK